MRKKLLITLLFSCLFLSAASVTFAYLTDTQEAVNRISPTENQIHIEEEFAPPKDPGPGSVITKAPRVVNDSEISVYVRMAVYFSDSAAGDFCEPLEIGSGWISGQDGYYYYMNPLEPGKMTEPLFEFVRIRDTVSEEELIPFDIQVYAESVQMHGTDMNQSWNSYRGGVK